MLGLLFIELCCTWVHYKFNNNDNDDNLLQKANKGLYRRPCSDSRHVTAPYKLSFLLLHFTKCRMSLEMTQRTCIGL